MHCCWHAGNLITVTRYSATRHLQHCLKVTCQLRCQIGPHIECDLQIMSFPFMQHRATPSVSLHLWQAVWQLIRRWNRPGAALRELWLYSRKGYFLTLPTLIPHLFVYCGPPSSPDSSRTERLLQKDWVTRLNVTVTEYHVWPTINHKGVIMCECIVNKDWSN